MGWSYGWSSKAELIKHLEAPEQFSPGVKILEARNPNSGNEHWLLLQLPTGEKVIQLHLLEGGGGSWGYKALSEACGPYYYRVPLKWLEQAPVKNLEWRRQVYAQWGKEVPVAQLAGYSPPVQGALL